MSGGRGVLTPHIAVFARGSSASDAEVARAASGSHRVALRAIFLPEERSNPAVEERQMRPLGHGTPDIDDPDDVICASMPLLTSERVEAAGARRETMTATAMRRSAIRAALPRSASPWRWRARTRRRDQVLKDWGLSSSVVSSSAGIELMHDVIIVMGDSGRIGQPLPHRSCSNTRRDRSFRRAAGAGRRRDRLADARTSPGWSTFSPRRRRRRTAPCAGFATRCSTIRT